jgi:DNA-binding NarL/FixJ family response regulator
VVAGKAEVRGYVRECLRARPDLRLVEAARSDDALALVASVRPAVTIIDAQDIVLDPSLMATCCILLVDDSPHASDPLGAAVRLIARPFTSDQLLAEVAACLHRQGTTR